MPLSTKKGFRENVEYDHRDQIITEPKTPDADPKPSKGAVFEAQLQGGMVGFFKGISDFTRNTLIPYVEGRNPNYIGNPQFNPFKSVEGTELEKYAPYLVHANNQEEVQRIIDQATQEEGFRRRATEGGWVGAISSIPNYGVDPTLLIPATAAYKTAKLGANFARLTRVGVGAASGSAYVGGAEAIKEGILHQAQVTRTTTESTEHAMWASMLGGVLGAGIGAFAKGVNAKSMKDAIAGQDEYYKVTGETVHSEVDPVISRIYKEQLRADNFKVEMRGGDPEIVRTDSGGAAAVDIPNFQKRFEESFTFGDSDRLLKIYKEWEAANEAAQTLREGSKAREEATNTAKQLKRKLEKSMERSKFVIKHGVAPISSHIGLRSPIAQALGSEFGTMRQLGNELFEHNFYTNKNFLGKSDIPLTARIRRYEQEIYNLQTKIDELYLDYMGFKAKAGVIRGLSATVKSKIDTNLLDPKEFRELIGKTLRRGDSGSGIKQVDDAAAEIRSKLNRIGKEASEYGILKQDIGEVIGSYSYFPRRYDVAKLLQPGARSEFLRRATHHLHTRKGWDELEARSKAEDIYDNIVGHGDTHLAFDDIYNPHFSNKINSTKSRVLDMDDADLEDFLVSDIYEIIPSYMHRMASQLEFQKMLERKGFDTLADYHKALKKEYDEMYKEISATGDAKRLQKLHREFKKDMALMDEMTHSALSTLPKTIGNQKVVKGLRLLRQLQTTISLGGVFITSLTELAMAPMRQGLFRTVVDGYAPFIRNFQKAKLATDQMKDLGVGIELQVNDLLKSLQDGETAAFGHAADRLSRFGNVLSEFYGKATLLSQFTSFGKHVAVSVSQAQIMRKLLSNNNKDIADLARVGISSDLQPRIKAMFDKFGEKVDGSYISNWTRWSDDEAAIAFATAVKNDVESVILTPGKGDLPLTLQRNDLSKVLLQFKSFSMTASNRIAASTVQKLSMGELAIPIKLNYLMLGGYMVYALKQKQNGREIEFGVDKFLAEGITRTGMLGIAGDIFASLNPWARATRYQDRGGFDQLFGPSYSSARALWEVGSNSLRGEFDDITYKQMRRLVPYMGLFYLRGIFDKANSKKTGVKGK